MFAASFYPTRYAAEVKPYSLDLLLALAILSRIDPAKSQPDLAILYLGLFGWSLAVDAHIYRHALSIKMGNGVLLAVLIFAANFMLLKAVFG